MLASSTLLTLGLDSARSLIVIANIHLDHDTSSNSSHRACDMPVKVGFFDILAESPMRQRRYRLLVGIAFGALIAVASWALEAYFDRLGVPPDKTFLNDFLVGAGAAFLAYVWLTLLAERQLREFAAEKLKEVTLLKERNRMARDIHDTVAQSFTGIIVQLEAADDLPNGSQMAQRFLHRALGLARDGLQEMRCSLRDQRPATSHSYGLSKAILRLTEQMLAGTQVRVEFSSEPMIQRLPSDIEENLFHIFQEALTNVLTHAQASKVRVELTLDRNEISLYVQDDGSGFAPEHELAHGGFGLTSMRERAEILGGLLHIDSRPGRGTKVQAVVPLAR
jgi:signal transduction histidine kinase